MKWMVLFTIGVLSVQAQNQLGLRTSNYSGVNAILLNPSSFHSAPLRWDVNLVSAGAFAYNQFIYLQNTSALQLVGNKSSFAPLTTLGTEAQSAANTIYYNYFDQHQAFGQSVNAFITGPSLQLRVGKLSMGLFTNSRVAFSAARIDEQLDYYSLNDWGLGETKQMAPFTIASMAWAEVGINAATTLKSNLKRKVLMGATLKYLVGFDGSYFRNTQSSTLTRVDDNIYQYDGGPIEYAYTSAFTGENISHNGSGFSTDIGFTYIQKSKNRKPYQWKLGASLIDIGFIRFTTGSQKQRYTNEQDVNIEPSIINSTNLDEISSGLSTQVYNDANSSRVSERFTIATPSAVSFQFDYALHPYWFLNTVVNRRLNLSSVSIARENFWSASVRYESTWLEVGLPVVLYDDRHLRVGTWVRLWMLTIGSDHINSLLFKQRQFAGSDIYLSLRLNPHNLYFKRSKSSKMPSRSFENCYF